MDWEELVGEAITHIAELEERLKIATTLALHYNSNVARDCKTDADYLHEVYSALKANGEISEESPIYERYEEFLKKAIEIRRSKRKHM